MSRAALLLALCGSATLWPGIVACFKYNPTEYENRLERGSVSVSISRDTLPADGASTAEVTVMIPARLATGVTATLSTSLGSFGASGSTLSLPLDQSGAARGILVAGKEQGLAFVSASVKGIVQSREVVFTRAWPDTILIEPSQFSIQQGFDHTINLDILLRRSLGVPSPGLLPSIRAADPTDATVGEFGIVSPSDQAGKCTVRYTAGATQYVGPITLEVTLDTVGGIMRGRGTVQVIP